MPYTKFETPIYRPHPAFSRLGPIPYTYILRFARSTSIFTTEGVPPIDLLASTNLAHIRNTPRHQNKRILGRGIYFLRDTIAALQH